MNTRQRFGARLLKLRQQRDWSQERLSEESGVGVQHISNLERGTKEPCLDLMEKLAKSFEVTLAELLTDV